MISISDIQAQDLTKYSWHINKIIGISGDTFEEYELTKIEDSTDRFDYGNSIHFKEDKTFSCHYSAPCGNDCFPSSTGTYKFIDDNHIEITLLEFKQQGFCETLHKKWNTIIGTFKIESQSETTLTLKKVKKN